MRKACGLPLLKDFKGFDEIGPPWPLKRFQRVIPAIVKPYRALCGRVRIPALVPRSRQINGLRSRTWANRPFDAERLFSVAPAPMRATWRMR